MPGRQLPTYLHSKALVRYATGRGVLPYWFPTAQGGQVDIIYLDMSKAFDKVLKSSQTTHIAATTRFLRELTGLV